MAIRYKQKAGTAYADGPETKKAKLDLSGVRIYVQVEACRSLQGRKEFSLNGQRFSEEELVELERQNPNFIFIRS